MTKVRMPSFHVTKQERAEAEIAVESNIATGWRAVPSLAIANPESSSRGHTEQRLGRSVVCRICHARKPKRGGWSVACSQDNRKFKGA